MNPKKSVNLRYTCKFLLDSPPSEIARFIFNSRPPLRLSNKFIQLIKNLPFFAPTIDFSIKILQFSSAFRCFRNTFLGSDLCFDLLSHRIIESGFIRGSFCVGGLQTDRKLSLQVFSAYLNENFLFFEIPRIIDNFFKFYSNFVTFFLVFFHFLIWNFNCNKQKKKASFLQFNS